MVLALAAVVLTVLMKLIAPRWAAKPLQPLSAAARRQPAAAAGVAAQPAYVPWEEAKENSGDRMLALDCTHSSALTLTHHKAARNPPLVSLASECSTGLALDVLAAAAADPAAAAAAAPWLSKPVVSANHFDADAVLSIWVLLNREEALTHDAVLRHAARIGDMREAALGDSPPGGAGPRLGRRRGRRRGHRAPRAEAVLLDEQHRAALRPEWQDEYEQVLAGWRADVVLTALPGSCFEVESRYTQFVCTHSRPVRPRLDMQPLAVALNRLDARREAGCDWAASSMVDTGPLLRLDRGGDKLSKAQRYGHPTDRPHFRSGLSPAQFEAAVVSFYSHGLAGTAPKVGGWSWEELRQLNASVDWAAWEQGVLPAALAVAAAAAAQNALFTMANNYDVVVLGGGNSAGYVAHNWVKHNGGPGRLAIVGEEPYVSYERPALSKAYLFPEAPARLPGFHTSVGGGGDRQAPEWYIEQGIDFVTGTKVTAVDVAGKQLTTAAGETIGYGKLIVATGARPVTLTDFKTPGADLQGVHVLRNVQDADALIAAMQACKAAGDKAVCVGGGYIGMECAACLAMNGLDVTVVFPEDRMMSRLFTPEIAAFYEMFYADKGIKLIKGDVVTALEGTDGKVATAVLKSGARLEASLVLVGVGARPNTELFAGQLDLVQGPPGGIKVDGHLQTSNPDVYAIGDVATFPLILTGGTPVRQEHVTCCRQTAAHAVAEILAPGGPVFDYLPFFYSRVFNLSWQFYGLSEGDMVLHGDMASSPAKFGAYWVKDGAVVGAFLEGGSNDDNAAIMKAVVARAAAPADLAQQGLAWALAL
ncbi:monodehydroascorbate reductase [Micractinium conductrix]|uniref:monodehydroascorbate reductase (NADH) n=1 Tax=Micractinium conductrix TaxID=554055 RepID=A0A2P6VGL1_9CHLO|nr:monodehydroascorbate reductase [Micractinium conductrix]|eukprot:PSC73208.1 monodehydroascorbate reductase [Micractinium conductrix]